MTTLRRLYHHYRHLPELRRYSLYGALFLLVIVWLNYQAGTFAFSRMSNGVADLILDSIPRLDVSFVFIEGALLMTLLIFIIALRRPTYIPCILFNVAMFFGVRAAAVILTHLGPPLTVPDLTLASNLTERFVQGADYFFSGHTGFPLVIALVFWDTRWIRYLFIGFSIFFGSTALLGHLHYSIDVFSAPFIAHSVVIISQRLLPQIWKVAKAEI
ncbi:MAG: hypothetical protein A2V81_00615 [Candidatus Abawacabacteria bacterium RBG_16_42_10]|uniref:Sphingomyelin synthase-like domain-containing protein n=1 Tax=Candidatus Abawacabacteria bacterium RBG_16_42_10 TaxID=1817814 RepID=A0A1F4XKJ2_9BACT|nr:MAG: hypothetical protein A2V81_00615 [Candidatus Abawacabacteria bacterium RBG_16_42_10]